MKKLIYYITDHWRGHATRSVAVIRELEKHNLEVIIRNSNVIDFLTKSLPEIRIIPGITDVGTSLKDDGMSIDRKRTGRNVTRWIRNLDTFSKHECDIIEKIKPDLIVSDISSMPFLAAEKMRIRSLAISNFSWYDVLDDISTMDRDILKNAYDIADLAIQLPLGTSMNHFKKKKKVGIVSRITTEEKEDVKRKIGIREPELSILFLLNKSSYEIDCNINKNIKILSTGVRVKNQNTIYLSEWIEGQDLISAADLVICKCGYGVVSECLTNGIPFLYLDDKHNKEQNAISNELTTRGLNNRITIKELNNLNLNEDFINAISAPKKEKIDTNTAVKYILEILN